MKGIILAAGRGTRLRPLTDGTPKALLEVGSESILTHLIKQYSQTEVDEVVVVTGYRATDIEEHCLNIEEELNIEITTIRNEDYDSTDNLYSLYLALDRSVVEPFVISNGDVYCDDAIIERAGEAPDESIAFYDSTDFQKEELKLELQHGRPTAILDKGGRNGAGATIGVFAFNEEAAKLMRDDLEKKVLSDGSGDWFEASLDSIFDKTEFEAVDVKDYRWVEIDTEADLERANNLSSDSSDQIDVQLKDTSEK